MIGNSVCLCVQISQLTVHVTINICMCVKVFASAYQCMYHQKRALYLDVYMVKDIV